MPNDLRSWPRPLAAFAAGTALFALLPIWAPPIVLQSDELPGFLMGLGVSAVAGAVLILAAGEPFLRGLGALMSAVLAGAVLHTVLYAVPTYGLGAEPEGVAFLLVAVLIAYLGLPALIGAAVAGAVRVETGRRDR